MKMNRIIGGLSIASIGAISLGSDVLCITPNTQIANNTTIAVPLIANLPSSQIIADVELEVNILHDWVGDLTITLESPNGTHITLLDRPGIPSTGFPGPHGCGGANIATTFTDSASIPAESVCSTTDDPVISGLVLPSMPMSAFAGESASGVWLIRIGDGASYDAGLVTQLCLTLMTNAACPADLSGDGMLDFFDVSAFLTAFGNSDPVADFTDDGVFDFFDVSAFLAAFGDGCP